MTSQPMKMAARKAEETTANPAPVQVPSTEKIPPELNRRLRALAHDLSNSIETIMQACYLLAQAELDDTNKKWLGLVDQAARDAARINREIREILRAQAQ
jgi:signal transduction histidine kinase